MAPNPSIKVLLAIAMLFLLSAAGLRDAVAEDLVPKNSAVIELIGTFEGVSGGAKSDQPYYSATIHEVVVDPNGLFDNPELRKKLLLKRMDKDVTIPKGKSRLFVKPPDGNSGSWLLQ